MKKLVVLVVVAVLGLGLTVSAPAAATTSALTDNERKFVRTVRALDPFYSSVSVKNLVSQGEYLCSRIARFGRANTVVFARDTQGLGSYARPVVNAAVTFLCP